MRTLCFLISLIGSIGTVAADEVKCNYSGNQAEMNFCALQDFQKADRALNTEYKKLMAKLEPEQQILLKNEQRAWLNRRDPQCYEEVKDSEGGSIWPLLFHSCLKEATVKRTKELKQWLTKK
ncbi:MAG: lysozyme inhibitor LprI family protein [Azonexus sp.]|jgi:uncharacterized protein YecT (DUF1311 family)|nr:lysozyme inhibitor LprI family protein [Azonexus sp.]